MSTISERLAYILTFDTTQGVKSLQTLGKTADTELGKADKKLDKLGSNMQKFGAGAMAFAGIAGAGLFKMASGAADAEANMSALEQVVGDTVAHEIGKWAENSAKGVGLASKDAVAAATSFAQLGKIIGLGGQDLSKFSTDLVGLSADFAAFKNVAPEQALMDIQAAFAGSTEVMRKYGIFLDDATLKAAYFRETGEKVTGTLTAQQKIVAINAEMYRQGADMLGQWGRESGELQGQIAQMKANLTNLSDEIGAGVLPHLMTLMSVTSKVVGAFSSADSATNGLVGTIATFGVGALALGGSISFVVGKLITMRSNIVALATRFPRAMSAMTAAAAPLAVAMVGLAMHAKDAASDAARLTEKIGELGRVADDQALEAFNRALADSVINGNGVNNMLTELARTNLGAAQRIVELANAKGEDNNITRLLEAEIRKEIAAREQAAETADIETEALGGNTTATKDNAEAAAAAEKAHLKLVAASQAGTKSIDEQRAAHEALHAAVMGSANADLAYRNQVSQTSAAVANANLIGLDAKRTTEEKAQADRDAEAAMYAQADAAVKLADEQAAANGQTLDADTKTRIYKEELGRLAATLAPGSALRAQIDGYIDSLNRIPRSISTQLAAGTTVPRGSPGGGAWTFNHDGGIVGGQSFAGLKPDEVPTILQKGEAVLTKDQQAAALGRGAGMTFNLTVNTTADDAARAVQREVETLMWRYGAR